MKNKKPWSKLKTKLMNLILKEIPLDIHQAVYRMDSQRGSTDLPRYFVTLNKEIIFDYPKDFVNKTVESFNNNLTKTVYPHITEISDISNLLREYIDTPVSEVLQKDFKDQFGITNLLKASDRRIGKEKLKEWAQNQNDVVKKIIQLR